ncbi:MAG: ABC transporter substrate-binding protein [Oribacterium sp.]|nr:ABC transporter substrate-binding protein [Oribacterium sp.]MDY6308985.1 ABC transporter substrate-binding protein [Oribacterium sp.]MDY6315853.1 ABC transporter substrate-binding protein [Oribacterium sp.]
MKKLVAFTVAGAMAVSLAACGSSSSGGAASTTAAAGGSGSAASGDTIKLGVFEPKTGENGGGGAQEELGIEYANSVRPTVTVDGKTYTIELDWQDNQSDKTVAVTAAQKLISDGCVGVIGGYGSGVCIAAGSYFSDAKIPAIGTSCTNANVTLGNDYYFRTCYLDPFQGKVMANWAHDNGYTEVATIDNVGNEYTSGLVKTFTDAFTALGGTVVDAETFQTNESDFKAILTNIKNKGVKAVFAPTDYLYAPLLLNQAADLGLDLQWIAGDTWYSNVIIQDAGDNANGVVADTFYSEGGTPDFDKGFKEWINADESRKKTNLDSDAIVGNHAVCYDAYMVMCDAIEAANSLDGTKIRDAIAAMDASDGFACGPYKFDENGDAIKNTSYVCQITDGEWKYQSTETVEG